jgi:hypothetical protein
MHRFTTRALLVAGLGLIAATTQSCDVHGISNAGTLSAIVVSPNPQSLQVSASQQFTAVGSDFSGASVPIEPVWSVVSGGGTIAAGGMFTAGTAPGTYASTVMATSGNKTATATVVVTVGPLASITVTPNPQSLAQGGTQQFVAVGKDASGNVVQFTPTWSVVANGGSISSTGLFTAGTTAGTFTNTVQASNNAIRGTATVVVTPGALTNIVVTPNPASIAINTSQQFTARGTDASGNVITFTPTWSVTNGGGTIAASGLFTAGGTPGTFTNTVTATAGPVSGSATVNVLSGPVATITVTPNPAVMLTSGTQQFAAVAHDANGNILPLSATWSVVNGGGSINASSGLFTAGNTTGTFTNTIRASGGGQSGFATVTINAIAASPFIDLGSAAANGIMAGTAVSCTGSASTINANVSISPGNTITGPCTITGTTHLNDLTAINDQIALTAAYNAAAGKACGTAITTDLGGTTRGAGVYCGGALGVTGVLTLDGGGDPNAVFLFQATSSLTVAGTVVLINGAQAKNVYWQVGSSATLGTASSFKGNVLALTSITLVTGTTLEGRGLARNGAVSEGTGSAITLP